MTADNDLLKKDYVTLLGFRKGVGYNVRDALIKKYWEKLHPKYNKCTLGQIQDWFRLGNGQRCNLVTLSDLVNIVPSPHANHLY